MVKNFSFGHRGNGDWDVSDPSGRILAIRTEPATGRIFVRDERPGRTRDAPREFPSLGQAVATVTAEMMTEDAD